MRPAVRSKLVALGGGDDAAAHAGKREEQRLGVGVHALAHVPAARVDGVLLAQGDDHLEAQPPRRVQLRGDLDLRQRRKGPPDRRFALGQRLLRQRAVRR